MTQTPEKPAKKKSGFYKIGNSEYPSVTTILSVISKPQLMPWAALTAAKFQAQNDCSPETAAGEIYRVRDTAAKKGSEIHRIAEGVAKGIASADAAPEDLRPYIKALLDFETTFKMESLFTEAICFNSLERYAGTLDRIARAQDGKVWLLDYKTGKNVYRESGLQLAAYKWCDRLLIDGKEQPMPGIDKTAVLHLKADACFELLEFDDNLDDFLACFRIFRWQEGKK